VVGGPSVDGVVEEGRTGWSIPDRDSASFVEGIRARVSELVRDDEQRREMGERARASAQSRFAWSRIVQEHLPVYRAVSASPAAR